MNKKVYQQPALHIMDFHTESLLDVNSVQSNVGIKMGQGSNTPARDRQSSGWFDEDEE